MANKFGSGRLPTPPLPDHVDKDKSLPLSDHEARVIRLYLERVAARLDAKAGMCSSSASRSCYTQAARLIRESKPD